MNLIMTLAAHVFITAGFFCLTSYFYKEENDDNQTEREVFFEDLETPFFADEMQRDVDSQQRDRLSKMVLIMSLGLLIMTLIPNPLWGRLMFVACATVLCFLGYLLKRSARTNIVISTVK